MAIITLESFNELTNWLYLSYKDKLDDYARPNPTVGSTYDFLAFMETISIYGEEFIRKFIASFLEKMDLEFRNSSNRTKSYYVKQTRSRTIITMYGEITYKRTEYVSRLNGKSYIYVDSKLHLDSRQRYAPDVRAKVYSNYADSKSMTEVGRNIGDMIVAKYHNGNPLDFAIPRQTIQRILKSTKEVRILSDTKKDVDILNIMLDEKWIPGQHNPNDNDENKAIMTKAATIFEGYTKAHESDSKRNKLEGCTYYSSYNKDFSSELIELIDSKYNIDSISEINFMGDGANWIKEVGNSLLFPNVKVNKGLCSFHTGQALDKISSDKNIYNVAYNYLLNRDLKEFNKLIQTLKENDSSNAEKIQTNADYLKKRVDEIITMNSLNVPCAMEQVISHHLASQFTCVAKAYSPNNINYYTSNRDAYRNGYNMKLIYARANDLKKEDKDVIKINKNELDLSFFDNQSLLPYFELKVNGGTQRFHIF